MYCGSSGGGVRRNVLYTPDDDRWLSEPVCILRGLIELFEATPDDVHARGSGGIKRSIAVGQVGIRCIHCAHLPRKDRAKGASSYPQSIRLMNQAVRNWRRYHFTRCAHIPASVRERYESAQSLGGNSKKDSKDYWVQSCERMGLVDIKKEGAEDGGEEGIRFGSDADTGLGGEIMPADKDVQATNPNGCCSTGDEKVGDSETVEGDTFSAFIEDLIPSLGDFQVEDIDTLGMKGEIEGEGSFAAIPASNESAPLSTVGDQDDAIPDIDGTNVSLDMSSTAGLHVQPLATFDAAPLGNSSVVTAMDDYEPRPLAANALQNENVTSINPGTSGMYVSTTSQTATTPVDEAEGNTANHRVGRDSLLESIRLALGLARGIRQGHHGNQDAQVVADEANSGGSDILSDDERRVAGDLITLGRFLYKHFAGIELPNGDERYSVDHEEETTDLEGASASEDSRVNKRIRQRTRLGGYVPLRDMGFPVSLCILVSSLMDAMDKEADNRFKTAEEVETELHLMTLDPDRYLFDVNADQQTGQLELQKDRLYGREQDVTCLMGVFDRVIGLNSPSEMVMISGHSGTGKSALVEKLRQPLCEKKGHLVSVKFDELGQVQPMTAIFGAFNDFCRVLLEGDAGILAQVRSAIVVALGHHGSVLLDLLPNLRRIIGDPTSVASRATGKEGLNQFFFYFRLFVRAIASPSHPIIVLFDDLQWADKESLELLATLASDRETISSMFIGCYRDNEIGLDHPLTEVAGKITVAGVALTSMKLGNISRESVNALVSDTLHLSSRVTHPLADIMYAKSSGNPLFAVQFLRSLCDENVLRYSASSRQWEWDVDTIQAKDIADNVVDLMKQKMLKLDPDVQWLLKVAACLGSRSEASTIKCLSSNDDDDGSSILQFFDLAVNEGLMSTTGSCYKFSHDQIQQAAYSLIPAGERDALHLHIGRHLRKKSTEKELNKIVFIVLDQLRRGSDLLSDHAEKVEIAQLCLMAGEMARVSSAFLQASLCLLQGTALLENSDWEHNYNLSLELFTCCAEAQYVNGDYDGVMITLNPILTNGKCLRDKLRAYYTLLYSLGTQQGKQRDAIKLGLDVLAQLGESFPNEPSRVDVVTGFGKTKAMLDVANFEDGVLQMDAMEDATMLAIVKILYISSRYAYQVDQSLMSLMVFRMLQLSLGHGTCRETPYAFSMFGLILCARGDIGLASKCGDLALSLLEKCKAKEYMALVHAGVYGLIKPFSVPMQSNLPLLKHGHEVGMSMGDIEGASTAAVVYLINAFQSGSHFGPLAEEMRKYMQLMKEHKHNMLQMIVPYYQAVLNLTSNSEDPTKLTGDAMNQDELLTVALEKQLLNLTDKTSLLKMWLMYLFRRYDAAAELVEVRREINRVRPHRLESLAFETFYTGLTAIAMARKGDEGKWGRLAADAIETIKTWAAASAWNFQHKLDLLNAEAAYYLNGDVDGAAMAYDNAIRIAGERKFVHEQALASERAGIFYSQAGSHVTAKVHYQRAHDCYLEWGATRKAEDLLQHLESSA